jgi:hypothetical protein
MTKEFGICGEVAGARLIMPQVTNAQVSISIKTATGIAATLGVAGSYTAIETDHTPVGYDTATLSQAADTTEQTIVDLSGSGVLTNVVSPPITAGGSTMTIRVTIDGTVTTFTDVLVTAASSVLMLGGYIHRATNTVEGTSYTGLADAGYGAQTLTMLTPNQVIERGGIGMVFKASLKVTVQGSTALTAGSASNKAIACFSLTVPEGL